MAGVSITLDAGALDETLMRLAPIFDSGDEQILKNIAELGEEQTRRRITDEKTAPDGTPWKPNRAGTPILQQTGKHLLDSVASISDAESAEWGVSWEFAHIHQEGATIVPKTAKALSFRGPRGMVFAKKVTIPARPFVGLSDDNRTEIEDLVTDVLGHIARGTRR